MNPWLVIACPGSRADELAHCLGSLAHDPERTVIVSSANHDPHPDARIVVNRPDFSIATLWNAGLRFAYGDDPWTDFRFRHEGATHVAVFASDTTGHPGSIPMLADLMATSGMVMAGPVLDGSDTRVLVGPRTCHDRVPGGCFMLDASHRLLCDESYRWWYSDDSLEMEARKLGPVGVFAGTGLSLAPDTALTEERFAWAREDRERFVARWKCEPW